MDKGPKKRKRFDRVSGCDIEQMINISLVNLDSAKWYKNVQKEFLLKFNLN